MTTPIIKNYGILASISWNSNKWADNPTIEDLKASKYDYVKNNAHMHESINFGHEKFTLEDDGYYIGSTPMFNRPPNIENSKEVSIVFFISSDYINSNRKVIIGFYGFPLFGEWYSKTAKHPFYKTYNNGNIKALPKNIVYFDTPIIIDNEKAQRGNLLPKGKQIAQQGFNYLNSENVHNTIALALKLNPTNKKLKSFVERFSLLIEENKEESDFEEFYEAVGYSNANTLQGISELENKMKNQQPKIKQRISSYIERGAIANKIKKLTGHKCLVCEAIGLPPLSFLKRKGDYYIETHHVEQVSTAKKGILSISNLITVCANHHRQLHYG
ncbi:MAG: HNH endonuclease, partial [Bacteroidota bacterium]|nr:HNH endonuclease [Bacteroidota bacterium]